MRQSIIKTFTGSGKRSPTAFAGNIKTPMVTAVFLEGQPSPAAAWEPQSPLTPADLLLPLLPPHKPFSVQPAKLSFKNTDQMIRLRDHSASNPKGFPMDLKYYLYSLPCPERS